MFSFRKLESLFSRLSLHFDVMIHAAVVIFYQRVADKYTMKMARKRKWRSNVRAIEVDQKKNKQDDAEEEMKQEADSGDKVGAYEQSDLLFVMRKMQVVEQG